MSIFKCKMCGGTIEFEPGDSVGICDSCGIRQTLPKLDDDHRANLYDRANHFRRNNEFDKAVGIYERILNEDNTDAEAYWSLVLCRYGIEYVEDPVTKKRVPTINRIQFTSIFDDDNFKSALQYADEYQRSIYQEEAAAINEIQKGFLAISQKEEPFDVFICYKETDNSGRRTQDSVLANDLYHQLTAEGFKVFFSRITLEDKLGTAYEPYIFAALNSARVMVVVGTRPEYFNAVWVRNEWSRYLALVRQSNGKKMLIPAYRDMDPYDLPEEFSHLQAQDMSKLGFMQDLIRGIKKIAAAGGVPKGAEGGAVSEKGGSAGTAPLLKRAFLYLEDGDWANASAYCERVLDNDPENAQAYLGKLMAEVECRRREELKDCAEPFDNNNNYQKVLRFGDEEQRKELQDCIEFINHRNEQERFAGIYHEAVSQMQSADTEEKYQSAAELFKSIPGFEDADGKAEECFEKAESMERIRKDAIYAAAVADQGKNTLYRLEMAAKAFSSISGWRDADDMLAFCQKKIEEIENEKLRIISERENKEREERLAAERRRRRNKVILIIVISAVLLSLAFWILFIKIINPSNKYRQAMGLMESDNYEEAYNILSEMSYKDSEVQAIKCQYMQATDLMESNDYEGAYALLTNIEYEDSTALAEECEIEIANAKYEEQIVQIQSADVGSIVEFGCYEQDNDTANGEEDIEWRVLAKDENKVLVISEDCLDYVRFNLEQTGDAWETCSLRQWFNTDFLDSAFKGKEKEAICSTLLANEKGNDTTDKVFLLSIGEVNQYFSSDEARISAPTHYATQIADLSHRYVDATDEATCWWLRSPSDESEGWIAFVTAKGRIYECGTTVGKYDVAVRPAMWINLEP